MRLTQVLANLLSNAVRYTPPGGHIELAARVDGAGVQLAVSDDGEGLDEADLTGIFEMSPQVRGETPREHSGLGIGLTLSQRIVDLHGGQLTVSSRGLEQGSRVHILQGASSALEAINKVALPSAARSSRAARIVIVGDNRDAADTLAKVLGFKGHKTRVAYNGRGGLEAIEETRPEIVFLDIGLLDITGYQVALELAGRAYRDELTLIALTGRGMAKDRERSHDAGFELHLTKPVSARTVLELMGEITASRDALPTGPERAGGSGPATDSPPSREILRSAATAYCLHLFGRRCRSSRLACARHRLCEPFSSGFDTG